jgi:hypothetical protein
MNQAVSQGLVAGQEYYCAYFRGLSRQLRGSTAAHNCSGRLVRRPSCRQTGACPVHVRRSGAVAAYSILWLLERFVFI